MAIYKLLAKDTWGIGSSEPLRPGERVRVKKKDGTVKVETVLSATGQKDGLHLYSIVPKVRTRSVSVSGVRCPICGSKEVMVNSQGRPYFCDECDAL